MEKATRLKRAARVILVGAPGVGKGTQTERLIRRYPQLSSISSGDLLRNNVRNRTPLGVQAEAKMKAGELVPDNMILRLIYNELKTRGWVKSDEPMIPYNLNTASADAAIPWMEDPFVAGAPTPQSFSFSDAPTASFILDGFPRNATQAAQIDKLVPINLVVNINTSAEIVIDRICNRWVHEPSGRVYNTTFNAPKVAGKDDVTGEPLTRRPDDDPDVWRTRLSNFEKTSLPLLEHYDRKGVLWTVKGNSSDEISPKLFAEFDKRFSY
jgi:adenylate kinase